ncbi:cyclic nucleotide-gated channel alpha-4 [Lonchura striata]
MPRGRALPGSRSRRSRPVSAAPEEGRGGVGRGPGPPGPRGPQRDGALAPRHCGPLGPAPAALTPDTAGAGPVPPAPRAKGGRRPGRPSVAAQGRADLPRGAPAPRTPHFRCPRWRGPYCRCSGAPGRSPATPGAAPVPRSPPAPATGPAPPAPSSRRARRTARAGHAHRRWATPPRHGDTPTPLVGVASPRKPERSLARTQHGHRSELGIPLAQPPLYWDPLQVPTLVPGNPAPNSPCTLHFPELNTSESGTPDTPVSQERGWVPVRNHARHRGRRQRLAGAQVRRTPGHRDARDPRSEGSHRDPRLPPVPPPGRAPAQRHLWSHGHSQARQRHRTFHGVSGARLPPAGRKASQTGTGEPRCLCTPRCTAAPRNWSLDPAGDWHYRWISLMVLPILYNWVVLILRCCFSEVQEAHAGLWQALDGLSDALYLLDMAVHLHTGFLEDGILVRDVRRTRRRYLGSWTFPWDVLAVLPTELLCLLPGVPRVARVPAARANRCLRLPRLFEAFDRCETRTGRPNVFRVAKLMLYLLLGIHWHGCLYFALSARLGLGADPWVCPSFTRPLRRYLHSFYFSTLVLAMVGDTPAPQREEEFLFLTAGFLLAVLGFATITGSISTVIVNLSSAASAFYPDAGPVRRYLRARGVDGRLAGRVARWHQHLRAQRKLPAEWEVLQHLPQGLQAEVAASVHLAALRRVGLFRSWEHGVLRQLVLRLRPQVFGPGEFVCRRGDVGREMYFIREGRLAVVAEDGVTQLAVLGEGLYFGEISLINIKGNMAGNRRTANILSIGYSDLFCLGKEDLAEVLAEFPCARAAMEAKGRELLLCMGQLDTGAEAAALAAEAEAERRLQGLEVALEGLQTRAARLLAQLEAGALRAALRVRRLEGRLQLRGRAEQEDGAAGTAGTAPRQRPASPRGATGEQSPSRVQASTKAQAVLRAHGPLREQGPSKGLGVPRGAGVPRD